MAPRTASAPRADDSPSGAQAVLRALDILSCFKTGTDELGISEISRRTSLTVSTAHRIVKALCSEHFMEQDRDNERYRLGPSIAILGQRAMRNLGYTDVQAILDDLAQHTGESASLGVRRGDHVLVRLSSVSSQRLRFDHDPGSEVAVHSSAMGKVLLAAESGDAKVVVAQLGTMTRYTPATIATRSKLAAELDQVRAHGFAVNREERYPGVFGVAVALTDPYRRPVAAVGLQGPALRFDQRRIEELVKLLHTAADRIVEAVPIERL